MRHYLPFAVVLAVSLLAPLANAQLRSEPLGFNVYAIAMEQDPADPNVQYLYSQGGIISVVDHHKLRPNPLIHGIGGSGAEGGLLGLAFPADYAKSGYFYVAVGYGSIGEIVIDRYTRSESDRFTASILSRRNILVTEGGHDLHFGGDLHFGEDGYLYLGIGDGLVGQVAQDVNDTFRGKIIRIDVNGDDFPDNIFENYAVPSTNPFVGKPGLDEIWAFGLRNPWRWSFDRKSRLGTGGMWINDVGDRTREEIDYQKPGVGGQNYGWWAMEGFLDTGRGGICPEYPVLTPPVLDYDRSVGGSTIGGYVYRGVELGPEYWGRYFYGDYISHRIWALAPHYDELGNVVGYDNEEVKALASPYVTSFGEDAEGELYIIAGQVSRIHASQRVWMTDMAADQGLLVSGGTLRHLIVPDGNVTVIGQTVSGSRQQAADFKGGVKVGFMTDQMTATQLHITVSANATGASGVGLRVLLKNWKTGEFESVGTGALSTSQQLFDFTGIPAAAYRREDGRIEMVTRGEVQVPSYSSRVAFGLDQVWIRAN